MLSPAVDQELQELAPAFHTGGGARRRWVLVEGDCREVAPRLWPGSVAMVLTDPPYGISRGEDEEITRDGSKPLAQDFGEWDRLPEAALGTLIAEAVRASAVAVKGDGAAYLFTSDLMFGDTRRALAREFSAAKLGFFTWAKPNPAPSNRKAGWLSAAELLVWGRREGSPFEFPGHHEAFNWMVTPAPPGRGRRHPTQKPVRLLERLIRAQTAPGDLVLDLFAGSAAVGEAALRAGRRYLGVERDPAYAAKARAHLATVADAGAVADAGRAHQPDPEREPVPLEPEAHDLARDGEYPTGHAEQAKAPRPHLSPLLYTVQQWISYRSGGVR